MAVRRTVRFWVYILAILIGITLGGLIAMLVEGSPYLWWLGWGPRFGFELANPIHLDLSVFQFTFSLGIWIKINAATVIGIILSILIFRKL